MADFRLSRQSSKGSRSSQQKEDLPVDAQQSLLAKAGGGAQSALHTVGSILSAPSRAVWGSVSGLSGHGYGNMSILDSTGGKELSHVLGEQGVIAQNDESKWEIMPGFDHHGAFNPGDIGRGLIDLVGDPTSWLAPLALTKAGTVAAKIGKGVAGGLEHGVINQIAKGQRGLVGLTHPLGVVSHGAIGTGQGVADALEAAGNRTGITRAAKTVAESGAVRNVNALFRAPFMGKIHNSIQKFALGSDYARRAAHRANELDVAALVTKVKNAGHIGGDHAEIYRDILEGIPHPRATPEHHALASEMKAINDRIHDADKFNGIKTGDLLNDDVEHFSRRMSSGIEGAGSNGFEVSGLNVPGRDEIWKNLGGTNAINRMLTNPVIHEWLTKHASHLPRDEQIKQVADVLRQHFGKWDYGPQVPGLIPTSGPIWAGGGRTGRLLNDALEGGGSRFHEIAKKMVGVPELRTQGLFGNHPLHDLQSAARAANNRQHGARLAFDAISDAMHAEPHGTNVGDFLKAGQFDPGVAAHEIAKRTGRSVDDVLHMNIPDDLAHELKSLTPGFRSPPAAKNVWDTIKSLSTIWKASTLAMPASRVRDAVSGVVQNLMMGHSGVHGWNEARNIAHAAKLSGDYSHLPEVADLMTRHGLSHDDAVKAILSVEAPRSAGFVADTAPGQIGSTIEDMIANLPGHEKSGLGDVLKKAGKSFVKGELDRAGNPINTGSKWNAANPANVARAFGKDYTAYGPAAASNVISGATDEFNRHAGILGQMAQGYNPSVAGKATRAAQVDYDQSTYSPFERQFLKQLFPFYSFTKGMLPHTLEQLANPGGRLSQLVKAEDRSHGQDPSLPDDVLQGAAIPFPFGQPDDGTKRMLSSLGLMPENAVNTLGNLGSLNGKGLQSAGYGVLASANPLLRVPIERTTGQSFFKKGALENELTPNVGQILADIGTRTGLRDADAGPVKYPGSNALETAIQLSPLSRAVSTTRGLTDVRKGPLEKALNVLTGIRLRDVSPKAQSYTLSNRASELAKSAGAKVHEDVYFNKEELSRLEKSNPALAEKQKALQQLMKQLAGKSKSKKEKKPKTGGFRLSKAPK